jgi:hypothetical protein
MSQFNSYFKFEKIVNNPIPTYCGIGLHIIEEIKQLKEATFFEDLRIVTISL